MFLFKMIQQSFDGSEGFEADRASGMRDHNENYIGIFNFGLTGTLLKVKLTSLCQLEWCQKVGSDLPST